MTTSPNNFPLKSSRPIVQACAITFQGNASNQRQQDALFFLDDWYQETLGITEITAIAAPFCFAVSDGVASSTIHSIAQKP